MNVCPGEGVAYDSYYNETDSVIPPSLLTKSPFFFFFLIYMSSICFVTSSKHSIPLVFYEIHL